MTTTTLTVATVREAMFHARANLDDALDLIDEVLTASPNGSS
jgi:hypothetical protein